MLFITERRMSDMKNKKYDFRITEADLAALRAKAEAAGVKLQVYLIEIGLSGKVTAAIPADVRKDIAGFARNLNQLAHRANTTGTAADIAAVEDLRRAALQIVKALNREVR